MTTRKRNSVWSDPNHPYHSAPRDTWLVTGTKTNELYPCRCHHDGKCGRHCPCKGRSDGLHHVPPQCCAKRVAQRRPGEQV